MMVNRSIWYNYISLQMPASARVHAYLGFGELACIWLVICDVIQLCIHVAVITVSLQIMIKRKCDRLCKNSPCSHFLHCFTKTAVKS